jgi:RHS repeat-associated protein
MKHLNSYFLALAAVCAGAAAAAAQEVPPQPPVEFQFMLEFKTATTNRAKCGVGENPQQCPLKMRMFKKLAIDWGDDQWFFMTNYAGGVSYRRDTHQLTAHQEEFYCEGGVIICTNWRGDFTGTSSSSRNPPENFAAALTNCNAWSARIDAPAISCDGGITIISNNPTCDFTSNYCFNITVSSEESNCVRVTGYRTETLFDEYTTVDLLSPSGFDYPSGDWGSGSRTPEALSQIGDLERGATIQKMKYRFKVKASKDVRFEITYFEHFIADGTTNENVTLRTLTNFGTGDWAYYYPPQGSEIPPPYTNSVQGDCTYVVGARKWITLGCGGIGSACTACSTKPGGVSAANADYGLYASLSLGKDSFGQGAGALVAAASSPKPSLCTPAGLEYFGSLANVDLIRSPNGSLRQAKSEQLLANILSNSPSSYAIECYSPAQILAKENGLYRTNGSPPISSVTVSQGASTNQLLIVATGGTTDTYDYTWSAADQGWTLTSGGGLRKQTRSWNASALVRTNTVRNSSNQVVYQEAEHFRDLGQGWGLVLSKRVVGPQGPALTTQWSYYDNAAADGVNFGKLRMVIQPSGAWTAYQYATNGWLTKEVSQFLNAATNAAESQCRVVAYDYTPVVTNCFCTRRVETLLGEEIARQYTLNYGSEIRTIQCQTPGNTNLDAADNLVTVTRNYYDGDFVGKPKSVSNPDGTMQLYSYTTNSAGMTTVVSSGQPNTNATAILDGTATTSVTGLAGETISRTVVDIASAVTTSQDDYDYGGDDLHLSYTLHHLDGTSESVNYGCCGPETSTDRDGTPTYFTYDALHRQVGTTRNGITTTTILDPAGNALATVRVGTDNSQITLRQAAYDVAGRVTREINALNGTNTYYQTLDGTGQTVKTTTYPDGGTRIETYYQDGSPRSVSGTAAFGARYDYGVQAESGTARPYTREIKLSTTGSDTGEWTKTYNDMLGRGYKTVYADGASSQSLYNNKGQLCKQTDPDGVATLYQYNGKGEVEYTALDLNTNNVIDFAGTDRITQTLSDVVSNHGCNVRRTRTYVWNIDNEDTSLLAATREVALTTLQAWDTSFGLTTYTTTSCGNGVRQTDVWAPDGSHTVSRWDLGQLTSATRYTPDDQTTLSQMEYGYDAHGRQSQITDARNGTTTLVYNDADLVQTITTPVPAPGQAAQTNTTYYNKMLQATNVVQPDTTSAFTSYYPNGLPETKYGSRQYPVHYTYDYAGRLRTMRTWSNLAGNQGAATTTWNYNSARGWLDNKRYDDNRGPNYTYTAAGRLKTRTWARGLGTTNSYNSAGDLSGIAYSSAAANVTYGFDRRGRQTTAVQSGATSATRVLDDAGNLLSEACSAGPLTGLSVVNGYDQYLRRTNLTLNAQLSTLTSVSYGYGTASRLQTVSDGTNSATYTCLDASPLVGQIDFTANNTPFMSTVKQYDHLNRLTNISTVNSAQQALDSHAYAYNSANQRTRVTLPDSSYWVYTYDSLGQVTSGKKYWSDSTPVAGQQFQYTFDDIGNRKTAASGGDQSGANLRTGVYSANGLNQYTSRTVPGYVQSLGTANASATVTLWGDDGSYAAAVRQGDYFRAEFSVNNSAGPLWLTLTNLAVLNNGSNPDIVASTTNHEFVPQTPERFTYDDDGNLTSDGRWTYVWDAENRLVKMAPSTSAGPQVSLQFEYDSQGRRIRKQVWPNATWTGPATNDQRFVYDGWNLIAELNTNNSPLRTYTWGLDLSGSMQGAGGIGGLLFLCDVPSGICYSPAFDGNGNVSALINASDGTPAGQYERGPFGEVIRATGPMARANPFRFSTKYQDDETDLLYYGYRYYNASTGRWLRRDPVAETGGIALYCAFRNNPMTHVDGTGLINLDELEWCGEHPCCCANVHDSREIIELEMRREYGRHGNDDHTMTNAVKHCTWMCYVASAPYCNATKALALGMAHEEDPQQHPEDRNMDINNNVVGTTLANQVQNVQDLPKALDRCVRACQHAAKGGNGHPLIWIE